MSKKSLYRGRFAAAIAAAMPLCLVLGACSAGGSGSADADAPLRIYTAESSTVRNLTVAMEEFSQESGIKVEIATYPNEQLRQQELLELSSGSGAIDILVVNSEWLPEMSQYLEPLSGRIQDSDVVDEDAFLPSLMELARWDGEAFGIPAASFAEVMFYRTDLFEAAGLDGPPTTSEEFAEYAEVLTGDGVYGAGEQLRQGIFLVVEWTLWLRSFGSNILDEDNEVAIFNSEEGRAATQFLVDMYNSGNMHPGSIEWDNEGIISALEQGELAMGTTNYPNYARLSEANDVWAVAPQLPHSPDSELDAGITNIGGWLIAINDDSDRKDDAWKFLEHMANPATQEYLATEYLHAPTLAEVYDSPAYAEVFPAAPMVAQTMRDGQSFPRVPEWPRIAEAIAAQVSAAIVGDLSVDEALSRAEEEVNELLAD